MQLETVPVIARALGFARLIPFMFLALVVCLGPYSLLRITTDALLTYSAVIVSFLGAIHWGLAMRAQADRNRDQSKTVMTHARQSSPKKSRAQLIQGSAIAIVCEHSMWSGGNAGNAVRRSDQIGFFLGDGERGGLAVPGNDTREKAGVANAPP